MLLFRNNALILSLLLFMCASFAYSCKDPETMNLNEMLTHRGGIVSEIAKEAEKYRLQILYTQINRDSANQPHFTSFPFRVDKQAYFYPASTVKFPAAVLALEKLNKLNISSLNREAVMLTDSAFEGQTKVFADSSAENGLPSIAHYIKKILLVSDNDAFNRLYEFIGQGPLNARLRDIGLNDTRILHRLSVFLTEEQNRHTNPIDFLDGDSLIYRQPAQYNNQNFQLPEQILIGKGYMSNGVLVESPMNFSVKNAFSLEDQQRFLINVIFPNSVMGVFGLNLNSSDYDFLYQYMSQLARETSWPPYDPEEYYDGYAKFLMFGDNKGSIPDYIRIFNKIGLAYGFITDNAYIVDLKNQVEFFLSATLYVNENQILNDNTYEYEEKGLPFMADLGQMIYEYELKRKRENKPDLSQFKITYDQ